MPKKKSFKKSYKKRPKIPFHRKRWFWPVIVSLILAIIIVYLFIGPIFSVTEIRIVGARTLDSAEIIPIIEKEIISKIAFWESRSIFLINKYKVSEKIITTFPQLNSVKLKRSFPRTVVVTIIEREAVASWCRDEEECFLIDKEGVIFKETRDESQLAIIKGGDNTVLLSGKPISSSEMEFIREVSKALKDVIGLSVFNINNPNLFARTAENWEIRFTLMESPKIQTEKLILVLKNNIPEEKRSELNYIDVRFENRAYFKYKNDVGI